MRSDPTTYTTPHSANIPDTEITTAAPPTRAIPTLRSIANASNEPTAYLNKLQEWVDRASNGEKRVETQHKILDYLGKPETI